MLLGLCTELSHSGIIIMADNKSSKIIKQYRNIHISDVLYRVKNAAHRLLATKTTDFSDKLSRLGDRSTVVPSG